MENTKKSASKEAGKKAGKADELWTPPPVTDGPSPSRADDTGTPPPRRRGRPPGSSPSRAAGTGTTTPAADDTSPSRADAVADPGPGPEDRHPFGVTPDEGDLPPGAAGGPYSPSRADPTGDPPPLLEAHSGDPSPSGADYSLDSPPDEDDPAPMGADREVDLLRAELAKRELARRFYSDYLAYVGGRSWKRTRMSEYIAQEVQDFLTTDTGSAYGILLIETPPQHGKSMTVSETLPSWYLGQHPDHRVIIASYDSAFAERFCRRNKEKVIAHGFNLFGTLLGSINRAEEFELANGVGRLISRGLLSGITGNPANLIIIDDPVKNRQEADSPTYRSRVWNEWQSTLKSRLAAGGKVIVIMTPWHEDDFAGRLIAAEKNVRLLRLPVEAEEDDPLGRPIGAPLCPELGKDAAWLEQFKSSYLADPEGGQRAWAALYQCRPRVEAGNIVSRDWWRFYDPSEVRTFATEMISVDAAFKDGEKNDYVSIQVWGKRNKDYYLRYCLNKRLDFPATVEAIRLVRHLYPGARTVLIEDKANGPAIIQTLQREMFCVPVNPLGGKVSRVNAVAPAIESGHVHLPEGAPWVADFIDQFTAFPAGKNDDMVDAASQALNRLIFASGDTYTPEPDEATQLARQEVRDFNDPVRLFDAYGTSDWDY